MLLLIIISIYVYFIFSKKAIEKEIANVKWGIWGASIFFVLSLGLQIFTGILIHSGLINISLDLGVQIAITLLSYIVGGAIAYLLYQRLCKMPDPADKNLDKFGKAENQ